MQGALLVGMPYELTLEVLRHAAGRGDPRSTLRLLKNLRLVNKEMNHLATDLLVDNYIKLIESVVGEIRNKIGQAWGGIVSDERSLVLTRVFDEVAAASEELKFFKEKAEEKKKARTTIFKMEGIDNATKWQLLKACSLESELLGVKGVASAVKKSKDDLQERPAYGRGGFPGPDYDDPLRVPRPGGPPGGAPPIFGEPDPDHMRVPDWERDRNPPGMPGYPGGDPFSPFGPGGDPFGGPPAGRGRGPRGGGGPFGGPFGGPDPFNPHQRGPRGPRFI
ncbi:uncharacterized protein ACA1_070980 [Acanthamoeba castellanii str. Neff]|uniref:Uncharacterized protein n=1 Tax=Acanthamoeba castellanii (strain ATCC 30010 / Neff) TaxID=1257118 RepID=L8HE21_ACACF|nr:uncharacterized protein ACA1_070980 [Acanthamoeba castellanii str. Neff]ELR23477.1 hypothetical protein ACA1_070980 [Acanthamoeba castellanii str. Neff]